MRIPSVIVGLMLFALVSTAHAQGEAPVAPMAQSTAEPAGAAFAPTAASASARSAQVAVTFLPMLLGRVAIGPSGDDTTYNLVAAYGLGLSFGYRVMDGLSVGVAPQVIFHLSAKDYTGYSVIDSQREYDLMARIAYAYTLAPKLAVYADVLPGYAIVTYDDVVQGDQAPSAKGIVLGGDVGVVLDITDGLFANVGIGYQLGFQTSSGISDRDVKTRFLRVGLGGGVKF